MRAKAFFTTVLLLSSLAVTSWAAAAPKAGMPALDAESVGRTPPRLSFLDGQVSFWRPGAEDWAEAQINTALAPGDQLFIQGPGNLELQVGAQAFVRGGDDAQFGLETQEPDFLLFKVTGGRVSFDLRALGAGRTVEVDTPQAAFIINHEGYYRLEVTDSQTEFITRRTGRATAQAAGGEAVAINSGEAVVVESPSGQGFAVQTAPALDAWDKWNYDRTDYLLAARSRQYIPDQAYGAGDLDRYGSWRVLPTYGAVWVPSGVAADWAPYSTGSWMHDPYYGWTWVDTAPWGWAPYHYGRWVHVNSYWCWAPGPVVARPYYAPALVAFFGGPSVSVGISIGGPGVGWVALGWGEPLIPWWGRPGFIHRPWWAGWGGPHCINNRVISRRTIVRINDIHRYRNRRVRHALVVIDKDRFGLGRIRRVHRGHADFSKWRPVHRAPDIRPTAHSYTPSLRRGRRPPERSLKRTVVTIDRHRRPGHVTVKNPGQMHRTAVRSFRQDKRTSPKGGADARLTPRHTIKAPARDRRPVDRKKSLHERDRVQPRRHQAPVRSRPEAKPLNRSADRIAPKKHKTGRPVISPKPRRRALPVRPPEAVAPQKRVQRSKESRGSRRINVPRAAPSAEIPKIPNRRRLESNPARVNRSHQVRTPRRLPQRQEAQPSARIAPTPTPGSNARPQVQVPRSINQHRRGTDRVRHPGTWQRNDGANRPDMNRGGGMQGRGRFQRRP